MLLIVLAAAGCDNDDDDSIAISKRSPIIEVPTDAATIQAAIDVADGGDTIVVLPGVYSGPGNRDVSFRGKSVAVISSNGPSETIIDCAGDSAHHHNGFNVDSREDSTSVLSGFTIMNGFKGNGGAIVIRNSSPIVTYCIFVGNRATASGGAVHVKGSSASPRFINCTFVEDSSAVGSALACNSGAAPRMINCIIAFTTGGAPVYCVDGTSDPRFECSNIFGNQSGDFADCIEDQEGVSGNISAHPQFCGLQSYWLEAGSPCLPTNNTCGVQMGALGEGCP